MGGVEELGRAAHTSYVAHLGGPEVFGEMLWAEAWKRGWERAVESKVIGDGAAWIWNRPKSIFMAVIKLESPWCGTVAAYPSGHNERSL